MNFVTNVSMAMFLVENPKISLNHENSEKCAKLSILTR
jgi:hypothetical protein